MNRPPLLVRGLTTAFRHVPVIRGRGRVELLFHRWLEGTGFVDLVGVNGYSLEVSLDDLIGRSIYINGVWERENTRVVQRLLHPGSAVFDVGANTGYFTLLFSTLVGPAGRVCAFEPVPATRAVLERNLSRSRVANVEVFPVALSDHSGEVDINVAGPLNTGASHVVAAEADDHGRKRAGVVETLRIRCATGDEIWNERGRPPLDLVKIDIEGHELHALRGMAQLLAASSDVSVLIEVRDSYLAAAGGSAEELFQVMRSHGFGSYDYEPRGDRFVRNDLTRSRELVLFTRRSLK